MSNAPSGWLPPPYLQLYEATDYCYVDQADPGANFDHNFLLYLHDSGAPLESRVFVQFGILLVDAFALLVPGATLGVINPLILQVAAWQNGGSPALPAVTLTLKAQIVTGGLNCATVTWNSAAALVYHDWLQTSITFPNMGGPTSLIGGPEWWPAFDGLDIGGPPAVVGDGICLSLEYASGGCSIDNITIDKPAGLGHTDPDPVAQKWAVVQP